ncbi:hypothetical protein DYBT9623_01732 [Dyadobacter sp. CECT 9623]|uniref:Bacteriophage abortive infection AbiH n=1 Tax=Dyadobacter linearis TaxID=2823330 RepID=A0ABM8UNJ0_9BACT|nr:AbiH family protein [Dyadobacter sp. CECT 9623]CAG5068998.1 hypothetical protein DYBT9623_01732 [Dyadobacter sp. CECT 9623]
MNRIVILGNGFDIAHGLPTGYRDFINSLQNDFITLVNDPEQHDRIIDRNSLFFFTTADAESIPPNAQLYKIVIETSEPLQSWEALKKHVFIMYGHEEVGTGWRTSSKYKAQVSSHNKLIEYAFNELQSKTWGGFENDYRNLLVNIINIKKQKEAPIIANYSVESLNLDLKQIIELLYDYLKKIPVPKVLDRKIFFPLLTKPLRTWKDSDRNMSRYGLTQLSEKKANIEDSQTDSLENVLFLSFNYTSTIQNYLFKSENFNAINSCNGEYNSTNRVTTSLRYIHGDLDDGVPSSLIFGYGDELDEHQSILETLGNEFLKHIKSVLYTRSPYYREVIDFSEADEFDIVIYGHSCSNTDRTLLNTLFEHKNCISIQPYLYNEEDTSIYINIYRCFKDKKLMRLRVVDQTNTVKG